MANKQSDITVFTFKQKSPSDHVSDAIEMGQARTRALCKALDDKVILELYDVLSEFVPAARERVQEQEERSRKFREILSLVRCEIGDDEGKLKLFINLLNKPKARKKALRHLG